MLENRSTVRFQSEEILICKQAAKEFRAIVLDVSRGGMRIHCQKKLKVGSYISLRPHNRVRGRALVKAVVRWVRAADHQVGLEFVDSAKKLSKRWVRKLLPGSGAAWTTSKQQRLDVRAKARVPVVSSDGKLEGATIDLGCTGACLELSGKLEVTAGLLLCLPGSYLELRADILRVRQQNGKWIHSVRFPSLKPRQRQQLDAFVKDRMVAMAFEQHSVL